MKRSCEMCGNNIEGVSCQGNHMLGCPFDEYIEESHSKQVQAGFDSMWQKQHHDELELENCAVVSDT